MVGGYAKVSQNSVYLLNAMITQEILQITKITAYKGEVGIIDDIPFGILILVESQQTSAFSKA